MQPVLGLENWVFNISVETCLLFLSDILFMPAVSGTQQLGQISPDFYCSFSYKRGLVLEKERLAAGASFLW